MKKIMDKKGVWHNKKGVWHNKRGVWREYLLPLILGILVVGLVLFFIFHEYFTQDDINWETCRQSIIVRATLPDVAIAGINFASFKEDHPLKCQTNVKKIDFKNTEKAQKLVADTIAECWYLYLEGRDALFPSASRSLDSYCVPCARIHFDPKVKEFYSIEKQNPLNIKRALDEPLENTGVTYRKYLERAFISKVPAIEATLGGFYYSLRIFGREETSQEDEIRESIGIYGDQVEGSFFGWDSGVSKLVLPGMVVSDHGDILIFFQQVVTDASLHHSKIFWFQTDLPNDPFEELHKTFYVVGGSGPDEKEVPLCENYDGVPA